MKNRKRHAIVEQGLAILQKPRPSRRRRRRPEDGRRLRHSRADPARLLRRGMRQARHRPAASPANTASAICSCRATRTACRIVEEIVDEGHRRRGPALLGWRDVPVDNRDLGRERQGDASRCTGRSSSARPKAVADEDAFERRLFIARKVISNAVYDLKDARDTGLLPGLPVLAAPSSTRAWCWSNQLGDYYTRPAGPALRARARARPPALRHQHLPDLAAGASLPDGRAQRRDQHAARQRELDGGAAGVASIPSCSATTSRSSGRSPTRASPTPPASTTRSNSWCAAATRSPTP